MSSDPFNIPPESVTPGQLFMLLQGISTKQSMIAADQKRIAERLQALEKDTADMRQAWKTGGAVLRLVKWAATLGAAIGATWAFIKGVLPQ